MRRVLVGATMLLVAGMTAACGAPDDASKEDFCDAIEGLNKAGDDFDKNKDAFEELGDTGTPEGISDDGREGFEILDRPGRRGRQQQGRREGGRRPELRRGEEGRGLRQVRRRDLRGLTASHRDERWRTCAEHWWGPDWS